MIATSATTNRMIPITPKKQIKRSIDHTIERESPTKYRSRRKKDCYISKLPLELIMEIISYLKLDRRSLMSLLKVNKCLSSITLGSIYEQIKLNSFKCLTSIPKTVITNDIKVKILDVNELLINQEDINSLNKLIKSQVYSLTHLSISILKSPFNNFSKLYRTISECKSLSSLSLYYDEHDDYDDYNDNDNDNDNDDINNLILHLPSSVKLFYISSGWFKIWNSLLQSQVNHLRFRIWSNEHNPIRPYHLQRFNTIIEISEHLHKIEIEDPNYTLVGYYQRNVHQSMAYVNPIKDIKVHNWFVLRNVYASI